MIRILLRWLFKREYNEALELVKKARETQFTKYVTYETYDMDDEIFLMPICEMMANPAFFFWLMERKRQYERLVIYGGETNRNMNIGRTMAIDELLGDFKKFKSQHEKNLSGKVEVAGADQI